MIRTFEEQRQCDTGLNWVDDPYGGCRLSGTRQSRAGDQGETAQGHIFHELEQCGHVCVRPSRFQYTAVCARVHGSSRLPDAIQAMLAAGLDARLSLAGYWRDIRTPEDVQAAGKLFKEESGDDSQA